MICGFLWLLEVEYRAVVSVLVNNELLVIGLCVAHELLVIGSCVAHLKKKKKKCKLVLLLLWYIETHKYVFSLKILDEINNLIKT